MGNKKTSGKKEHSYAYIYAEDGDPYAELINAIIVQAVHDYEKAFCKLWEYDDGNLSQHQKKLALIENQLLQDPDNKRMLSERKSLNRLIRLIINNRSMMADVESFFNSSWFKYISRLDGEKILEKLEQKCYEICTVA